MPKGYLNDRGEPIAAPATPGGAGGGYLGDDGEPRADPINQPTPRQLPARADVRLDDTPGIFGSAGRRELMRTGKEAAIGLARSPLDAVKGLFGMVAHPIDTVTNTANAVMHPLDTIEALGDDPRAAGSMLGQVLLGKYAAPKVMPALRASAPSVARGVAGAGRAAGAVGRGMEAVGESAPARHMGSFGAMEAALRMDPKGLALAAAPAALKYGGKAVQAGGRLLERAPSAIDSLMGGESLETAAAGRAAGWRQSRGMRQSEEVPYRYAEDVVDVADEAAPFAEEPSMASLVDEAPIADPKLDELQQFFGDYQPPDVPPQAVGYSRVPRHFSMDALEDVAPPPVSRPNTFHDNFLRQLEASVARGR